MCWLQQGCGSLATLWSARWPGSRCHAPTASPTTTGEDRMQAGADFNGGFWAKLTRGPDGAITDWLSVADHCADVAACCEALLQHTSLRRRMAALGDLTDLTDEQVARLCFLAALHDVGKFNHGFQRKALGRRVAGTAGHVREVLALLGPLGGAARVGFLAVLPTAELLQWGAAPDVGAQLLVAAVCHHGQPYGVGGMVTPTIWAARDGREPFEGIADLAARARGWFPEAFEPGVKPLPAQPEFQHGFSGLVMLADWIGSDERFFPVLAAESAERMGLARRRAAAMVRGIGLAADSYRAALGSRPVGYGRLLPPGWKPRPEQSAVLEARRTTGGGATILEAATGAGKTEAAFGRYVQLLQEGLVDGMYFALPTRTSAMQIYGRTREAVERLFPAGERPPVALAVPGYAQVDGVSAPGRLTGTDVLWPDDADTAEAARLWAVENAKRYLAGSVVVGTVDQALLSALTVRHAHLRATALLRHLLVVDEVHASDAYMTCVLEKVLSFHVAAGGHALLMSATLGSSAMRRLVRACGGGDAPVTLEAAIRERPFPLVTCVGGGAAEVERAAPAAVAVGGDKAVSVTIRGLGQEPEAVALMGLDAASAGAHALILRNTVRDCVETQVALESLAERSGRGGLLWRCRGEAAPHHSRFARDDRKALDAGLERSFGKGRETAGVVGVATQTVQQSLDLDADLMITDLCPMDVLLQRLGRLHRHSRSDRPAGFETARVVVLVPEERDLGVRIGRDGAARGPQGLGRVYADLLIIEATWRLLEERGELRLPSMNRELVERSTHPEALAHLADSLGERWSRHWHHVLGRSAADSGLGDVNAIDRGRPFGELEFPSSARAVRIQTRLGADDLRVPLQPPVSGPFGGLVEELHVPAWMLDEGSFGSEPVVRSSGAGCTVFALGIKVFRYDRLGLRRVEEHAFAGGDV